MSNRHALISRAFAKKAADYETGAALQDQVAAQLAMRVLAEPLPKNPRILEIGCGTGLLTRRLLPQIPGAEWLVTDIAPSMVKACRVGIQHHQAAFAAMDGARPAFAPGAFDLVVSSLALQWFEDLGLGLAALAETLRPGGQMIIATLGHDTFAEWRGIVHRLGLALGPPDYPTAAAFPWPDTGIGKIAEAHQNRPMLNGHAFLSELKAIGAATPRPGYQRLPLAQTRQMLAALDTLPSMRWHILYGRFVRT